MRLQLVQIGIVGQIAGKMLVGAEGIEIHEHRVALGLTGVGHLQMVGVGEHPHDLGAYLVGLIGKVDAVAE